MKYTLVCITENGDIVKVEIFHSLEMARFAMANAVEKEKKDAESCGYSVKSEIAYTKSVVSYGESKYTWSIVYGIEKSYTEEVNECLDYYEGKLKELGYTTKREKNQYNIEYSNGEKTAIFSLCFEGDYMIAWKKDDFVSYSTTPNNIYERGTKLTKEICDKGFEKPAWIE